MSQEQNDGLDEDFVEDGYEVTVGMNDDSLDEYDKEMLSVE